MARLGAIPGLLLLAWASSVAVSAASDEHATDEEGAASALRGAQASPELYNERFFPADDAHQTPDPIALANESHHHRMLAGGEKRRKRREARRNGTLKIGECTGSRPRKCGCPTVSQADYRGKASTTLNGHACIPWKDEHIAQFPKEGLDDDGVGIAVCRNPGSVAHRAWCFVDDDRRSWDYCTVDMCQHNGAMDPAGGEAGDRDANGHVSGCVDRTRYYEIEAEIQSLLDSIPDNGDKGHQMGGMLRTCAHDLMDYDQDEDEGNQMGMDACMDWEHPNNAGLNTLWNEHTPWHKLWATKHSDISVADFWVMSCNAVVHIASKTPHYPEGLDLFSTFAWGRKDAESCHGAAERLPTTANCKQVEDVFLMRLGLTHQGAVCLLAAHTMGRGHKEFSGHHGKWMPNDRQTTIFDKKWAEEMVLRSWSKRHLLDHDPPLDDWTTGRSLNNPKMHLNTDVCLMWDIDEDQQCCTRTDQVDRNGRNRCESDQHNECNFYAPDHPRRPFSEAVKHILNGASRNNLQDNFHGCFQRAWMKATMNGHPQLKAVMDTC
ncbi:hypothetical protein ACHAXT_006095 [Thalassiosira profunda]